MSRIEDDVREEGDDFGVEDASRNGRTTEQEIAAGTADETPFALLGGVMGVIALLVAVVVALAVLAYLLA